MATFWTAYSFDQGLSYISSFWCFELDSCSSLQKQIFGIRLSPLFFFPLLLLNWLANWQSHYFDNSKPNKARSVEEWGYSLIVKAHKLHKNLEQVRAKQDFQHLKGCCKICQAHCFHLNSRMQFGISSTIPTSLSLKAILGTVKSGVQTEVATALATQSYTHSGTSSFLVTGKLPTV